MASINAEGQRDSGVSSLPTLHGVGCSKRLLVSRMRKEGSPICTIAVHCNPDPIVDVDQLVCTCRRVSIEGFLYLLYPLMLVANKPDIYGEGIIGRHPRD